MFDADGRALYAFTRDPKGRSTCYGPCAAAWPPYIVRGRLCAPIGVRRSLLGTTLRHDGSRQLTFGGRPLFFYVGDTGPGVVRCQNVLEFPHPDNRVTVDRQKSIHLSKTYHNTEPHRRLLGKLKALLGPIGCHTTAIPRWSVLSQQVPVAGIAHNCGTVSFGTDPATSALDVHCKAHDLDNIYVVDTSFFPSSSAVNPALTARRTPGAWATTCSSGWARAWTPTSPRGSHNPICWRWRHEKDREHACDEHRQRASWPDWSAPPR